MAADAGPTSANGAALTRSGLTGHHEQSSAEHVREPVSAQEQFRETAAMALLMSSCPERLTPHG